MILPAVPVRLLRIPALACRTQGSSGDLSERKFRELSDKFTGLKSVPVDAQGRDSCTQRLASDSQLFGCAARARYSAQALFQRSFDHLFLALDEFTTKEHQARRRERMLALAMPHQPRMFPHRKDNGSLNNIL